MYGGNMAHKIISFAFLVIALSLFGCASERYTQNDRDHSMRRDTLRRMTQQDVINLSKAGVSDSLIVDMMDATDTWFQLKPQEVIDLRNAGVSEKVISAAYPPYFWYGGFYPDWYYPRFSLRMGFHGFYHRRFR